jgi:hypothetical protein
VLAIFVSCEKNKGLNVDVELIEEGFALNKWESISFVKEIDSINFIFTGDTIRRNVDIDSTNLLAYLAKELKGFDTLRTNKKTSLYLKALFLADFVYASFSFQFLGDQFGLPQDSLIKINWDKLPLRRQFELGNSNLVSADCGIRTNFYMHLLNELLGLKSQQVSIEGIHTFPIVSIKESYYLIDPSEPIIFIHKTNNRVVTYDKIMEQLDSITFYNSSRNFGNTHMIVSNRYRNSIQHLEGNFRSQFLIDVKNNKKLLERKVGCFTTSFESKVAVHDIVNEINALAIEFKFRNFGNIISKRSIKRNYFGKKCKNEQPVLN